LSRFVAIKQLHSKNELNFKTEVAMLKKVQKRKHAHLVNLLATYRYRGHFHLIFPYAHCNLRQYWQHTPIPDFTQATIFWVLQGCRFVASALLMVHEKKSTREFAVSAIESSSSGVGVSGLEDGTQTRIYGRHGDIKAENILWFQKNDDSAGVLVVADFGLMAFHTKDTRSDVPAKHITGSPSYEPPECFLHHSKISRAFDIWSLGCLYLEFVSWLVCGWKHLQRFHKVREMRGPPGPEFLDDTFFTIIESENRAVVRQSVIDWIADLHEMPRASAFVHDFLDLISSRLLLVLPGERMRIGQLTAELSNMLERASNDPLYLTDPKPFPPRTQQPHPQSLAALHRNGDIISPATQEGMPLPRRLSGILESETPRHSASSNRRQMEENTPPISSPRLD
jgi:serine/threonine protein kinase